MSRLEAGAVQTRRHVLALFRLCALVKGAHLDFVHDLFLRALLLVGGLFCHDDAHRSDPSLHEAGTVGCRSGCDKYLPLKINKDNH